SFLFGENVRLTLNTLMREGKMEMRFSLFDSMSKELKGLKQVRVIRGKRVDEVLAEINEKELIPREKKVIAGNLEEIEEYKQELEGLKDRDERDDIMNEIADLQADIDRAREKISDLSKEKAVDTRESPKDALDVKVLKTGEPIYLLEGNTAKVLIPYKVKKKGCSETSGCHKYAKEGDVLGAIRMEFSLEEVNATLRGNNIKTAAMGGVKLLVFCLVAGGLLFFIITRFFSRMVAALKKMAVGDLSARLPVNNNDEIGQLSSNFNIAMESFCTLVNEIQDATHRVSSSSEELSSSAGQISQSAEFQVTKTIQVGISKDQMRAVVTELTERAQNASDIAREANKTAQEGGKILSKTVSEMNAIAVSVKELSGVITQLGKSSEEISEIIEVIDDIADQTNLLALNAAIEAARAGEQGRGFAVVADEVRKLAERTTRSTKEISVKVLALQKETKHVVVSMNKSTKEVEKEVELAAKAGDTLVEIVSKAEQVETIIGEISDASKRQIASTDDISRDIDDVANISKETVNGVSHINDAAQDLAELSTKLSELAAQFKVK
ncbi:MAG: HAMP domain-containing protein, partial [Proteobacteria bacterium]|nr:HAMP domain-containing protein [Pseudomonadota bacterium]